jgi:hypothetical protein
MNTSDIRDIDSSQSLYWTIAIPVTALVLALAFVYGYRGDEIGDWVHDRVQHVRQWLLRPHARTVDRGRGLIGSTGKELGDTRMKWPMVEAGVKETWKAVKYLIRPRARERDREVMRRSTFQTDGLP